MATIRLRLAALADNLRNSLWFLPAVTTLVAIVTAEVLSDVDTAGRSGSTLLFSGGSEAARTILGTIAGSMITVTGLTFSLTVVALQVASGQFTPRLLRTFLGDRGNQVVLSAFIATFAYSLVLLRTIRNSTEDLTAVVPGLGVTVAMGLALASVGLLVFFIHHLTTQLRVDTVMDAVMNDTLATIDRLHPADAKPTGGGLPNPPDDAFRIVARRSGYLQSLDLDALFDVGARCEPAINIRLRPQPGAYVVEGTTLAWAWVAEDGTVGLGPEAVDLEAISGGVHGALHLGRERSLRQDPSFGTRQLVDIATRALSPGVNDPTTAVQAIHRLTDILVALGTRPLHDLVRNDDRVVVGVPKPGFAEELDLAMRQIRRYGADEPAVARALAACLRDLAETVDVDRMEAVTVQLVALEAAVVASDLLDHDLATCEPAFDDVATTISGRRATGSLYAD